MVLREIIHLLTEENKISSGAFGAVYRLEHTEPPSVFKLFHRTPHASSDLKIEYTALEKLRHPNIVQYFGFHDEIIDNHHYRGLQMEYCQHGALSQIIFRPSMIYTIYTVVQWAEHLFKALVYLEKNGKIHCDIKVDNILVSGGFVLKLGDLGLVKSVIETSTVSIRGTPRYMAPEILYNNEQGIKKDTSKRDIWGVGLVLWEIVERRKVLDRSPTVDFCIWLLQTQECLQCPEDLKSIIIGCLCYDYKERATAAGCLEKCSSLKEKITRISNENYKRKLQEFLPFDNNKQKTLLRPIGFDGSEELVAVEPNDDSFLPPAPSILNRSAIFTKVNNKSKIDQKEVDPQKILEEKYPELKKLLSLRLKDPKIARLQEFFRQLPTELIVEYAEIAHERIVAKAKEITIFEMKREHRSSFFEDQILEDEGDGGSGGEEMDLKDEVAFLASEAAERCCLKLEIHYFRAIRFIWTFREGSFGNWFVRTELSNLIALFEVWRSIVQKRLHFRSFFSMSTKEEWLLGGKISNNRCLFVRKDLMNAKIWLGSWQDEESFLVAESVYGKLEEAGRMIFVQNESIDISMIISALERIKSQVELFLEQSKANLYPIKNPKTVFRSTTHGLELPVPGYVFQLKSSPQVECPCERRCDRYAFAPEVLLELPACAEKRVAVYHFFYLIFYENIVFNKLAPEFINNNQNFRNDIAEMKSKPYQKAFGVSPEFLFCKLKDPEREHLILLDFPDSDNCKVRCFNENFELLELEVSPEELDVNNFHKLNIFEFIENQHTNSLLKSVAAMFEELDVEELNDQTEATSRAKRIAYKVGKKLVADHFESNEKPSFNAVREAIMKQAKAVRLPVQVWENFTTGNPSSSERQASKIYHLEVPAHSDEIKFQAFLAEIKNKDIKKSKEKYGTVDDFKKRQNKAFALVIQTLFDWSNRCCLGCLIKGVKVVKIFKEILAFAGPHTYVTLRVFLHNETSCVYLGEAYGHHHFCELDFKTAIILDGFWKSLETFQARDPITRQVKDIEFKGIAKVNLSLINKQLIELMNEVKKRALQIKHPFKISETESFFLLDLQPNQDCISSNPGPSSKSDDQQFKLQYLSYARLYLSLCRVLTQAQSLHDYLDLIKIIVEIIEFKEIVKRVDNRCPKHFFFIKLNKERNVVIVNLHPFEKDDVEHFHVLLLDLDSMSFSRDDFSFTELLRASEETPFHKLHLIEFLSFNLIEKLFTVFSTNYQNRNDLCPFLKNLCIESDDLDLYLSMTLGVCLDFFNEKEQGSGRDPHFNPLEKKSKSPMKLELARQLLYALKAL